MLEMQKFNEFYEAAADKEQKQFWEFFLQFFLKKSLEVQSVRNIHKKQDWKCYHRSNTAIVEKSSENET